MRTKRCQKKNGCQVHQQDFVFSQRFRRVKREERVLRFRDVFIGDRWGWGKVKDGGRRCEVADKECGECERRLVEKGTKRKTIK